MEVSAGDVLLYAEVVSGKRPAPSQGQIRLRCIVRPDPEHFVVMSVAAATGTANGTAATAT